jgi:hypothetical protein
MSILVPDLFGGQLGLTEETFACVCPIAGCGELHNYLRNPALHPDIPRTESGLVVLPGPSTEASRNPGIVSEVLIMGRQYRKSRLEKQRRRVLSLGCRCFGCREGLAALKAREQAAMARSGWYGHVLQGDGDGPTGFNAHTHGLEDSFGHPDLEIVLPMRLDLATRILREVVGAIRAGTRLVPGQRYEGILANGYCLEVMESRESGRFVLRLILPDSETHTARGELAEPHREQWGLADLN